MKTQLLTIAMMFVVMSCVSAEPAAKITLGVPNQMASAAGKAGGGIAYIELPVTITNTSKEAIHFGTNPGPFFQEYVQRRKTSRHWSSITPRGGTCGMGYSLRTLAPGESYQSTVLILPEHAGRAYRLALKITESNRSSDTTIKSSSIVLPKSKG